MPSGEWWGIPGKNKQKATRTELYIWQLEGEPSLWIKQKQRLLKLWVCPRDPQGEIHANSETAETGYGSGPGIARRIIEVCLLQCSEKAKLWGQLSVIKWGISNKGPPTWEPRLEDEETAAHVTRRTPTQNPGGVFWPFGRTRDPALWKNNPTYAEGTCYITTLSTQPRFSTGCVLIRITWRDCETYQLIFKCPRGLGKDAQQTNHQGNANQNHNEISPHTCKNGYYQKQQQIRAGKDMEKR